MLEMEFTLLDKRNKLIFLALTGYAVEGIRRTIMYIILTINTHNVKTLSTNMSIIWTHQFLFIVDKLSKISY